MKVVVFGVARSASLAWYSLTHDSEYEVVGFTVDGAYLDRDKHHILPVHPFEDLERHFDPSDVLMLIPMGFFKVNAVRADRYFKAKSRGYRFASYISTRAMTWPDLEVGENSMVYDGAIVQPFTTIGDNTIVRSGAHLSHHNTIGNHCFIAPRAAMAGSVTVEDYCVVGANATVREDVVLGTRSFVAAGAVVLRNTKPAGVYSGVPAKRRRLSLESLPL